MSRVYEAESQTILRLPPEIAKQVNEAMEKGVQDQQMELYPIKEPGPEYPMTFQFKYGNFVSRGTLLELPTISESHKTLDHINYFKSNDISQMIFIHPNNEDIMEKVSKSRKIAKRVLTYDPHKSMNVFKYHAKNGLTKPTKLIRRRFYRKKILANPKDVAEIEKSFMQINQELTKSKKDAANKKGDHSEFGEGSVNMSQSKQGKRRYRKKVFYK